MSLLLAQTLFRLLSVPKTFAAGLTSRDDLCSQARLRTVKILLSTNTWGSGTLVHRDSDQYTLVTNGHVLHGNKKQYEVKTHDGQPHQASVIDRFDQDKNAGTDLAIMRFSSSNNYEVFNLSKWIREQQVIGFGFPVNLADSSSESFLCTEFGQAYSLDKPMKKGYQLGFDLSIPSGMSGGPLINELGELVGINGMGDPLIFINPDVYRFRDNTRVSEEIAKQRKIQPKEALKLLSNSSWAIPIETLINLLPRSLNLALQPSVNKSPDKKTNNPLSSEQATQKAIATSIAVANIVPRDIAKKVAVSVGLAAKSNGKIINDPTGTGVIIGKKNKTYYVLTTEKIVHKQLRYGITTPDQKNYLAKVFWKKLDLAILEFDSGLPYEIVAIANVDKINTDLSVYIYGWTFSGGIRTPVLTEGLLMDVALLKLGKNFVYENRSNTTLNSGLILNGNGQLIGLHKEFLSDGKTGKGISIHNILNSLPLSIGLATSPQVAKTNCEDALFGNCLK